jgi:flagellin-like protein
MKSITPVISIILLVALTITASGAAYFFITSTTTDLQSGVDINNNPMADSSRLNLVSITGSKAIVRNDGSAPVTEVVMFVNGELLNYTLDTPIQPGEYKEINYTARETGEDLEIKVIYNTGKIVTDVSPAIVNTQDSGFTEDPLPLNSIPNNLPTTCQETVDSCNQIWFEGNINSSDYNYCACCGNNATFDNFYNDTYMCSYGGIVYDEDALWVHDWLGDYTNYTSGKGICESKDYSWIEGNASFLKSDLGTVVSFIKSIAVADMDNDGDLDLVFGSSNFPYVWLNNGVGGFSGSSIGTGPDVIYSIALGDLDGDGDKDIVIGSQDDHLYKWIQHPVNTYTQIDLGLLSGNGNTVGLGDLDNDGDLDIITGDSGNHVYWWENTDGLGSFNKTDLGTVTGQANSVSLGDLDGDGDMDFVIGDNVGGAGHVYKWIQDPINNFTSTDLGTASGDIMSVSLGDLDNDGDLDIVSGDDADHVYKWINNGTSSFTKTDLGTGSDRIYSVVLGDLDNDGDLDIVSGDYLNHVYKWINDGTSSFTKTDLGTASDDIRTVVLGDFDIDGDLDIISGDWSYHLYRWENIGLDGSNGPCCGDDLALDNFTNSTHQCINGIFSEI